MVNSYLELRKHLYRRSPEENLEAKQQSEIRKYYRAAKKIKGIEERLAYLSLKVPEKYMAAVLDMIEGNG